MIDPAERLAAMNKHGAAQVRTLPVYCRIPADPDAKQPRPLASRIFPAAFAHGTGDLLAVDGGIVYDRGGNIRVSKGDVKDAGGAVFEPLETMPLEMVMRGVVTVDNTTGIYAADPGAVWKTFNIENVSGYENPTAGEARIAIGPHNN